MKLPKELTTVTPLSKALALVLFITLPMLGFYIGMQYNQMLMNIKIMQIEEQLMAEKKKPTPTPDQNKSGVQGAEIRPGVKVNWRTHTEERISFEYPSDWIVKKVKGSFYLAPKNYPFTKTEPDSLEDVAIIISGDMPNFPSIDEETEKATLETMKIDGINAARAIIRQGEPGEKILQYEDVLVRPWISAYSFSLLDENYTDVFYQLLATARFPEKGIIKTGKNVFNFSDIKQGSKVKGLTVKNIVPYNKKYKLSPVNAKISFTGTARVRFEYHYASNEPDGIICFIETDSKTRDVLPIIKGTGVPLYVCFENQSEAKKLLQPPGKRGIITADLDNFTINSSPNEVRNTARLLKVLDHINCSTNLCKLD